MEPVGLGLLTHGRQRAQNDSLRTLPRLVWARRVKVIIAGGREITDYAIMVEAMEMADLMLGIVPREVVSGKARGADALGEMWAIANGVPVKAFPAKWRDADGTYYPRAGMNRNSDMAAYADALVAVWDGYSSGTADMIKKARKRGLLVWVQDFKYPSTPPDQSVSDQASALLRRLAAG